ncbi:MAG: hypothetical protein K2O54_03965, partial [Prevotella sp.]|nr:hypothetical protein [Prevotella sp.]
YKRDILGLRIAAVGIIFRYFANNRKPYVMRQADLFNERGGLKFRFTMITIGIDFGGNKSRTTYYATGFLNGFKKMIVLDEEKLPITEEVDTEQIQKRFVEFFRRVESRYGYIQECFGDNAATTLVNSLKKTVLTERLNTRMNGCDKETILERVRLVDNLLRAGRLIIVEDTCHGLIKALSELKWDDEKEDEVEDLNIGSINDYWDGFNYTFTHYMKKLTMW